MRIDNMLRSGRSTPAFEWSRAYRTMTHRAIHQPERSSSPSV
jgi:hypothetical protein